MIEREGDKREHQHVNREKLKQNLHKYSQLVAVKIYEQRKEKKSLQLCKADATDINVELKDYQMTGQSLLTRDADNNWKFAHKSILEYFLAKEALDKVDFALTFDFTGMDMAWQFCRENHAALYLNFVLVKGNTFVMSSQNKTEKNETQNAVIISDFYICKYAVTLAEFKKFIDDSGYQTDAEKGNSSGVWDGKEWKVKKGVNWRHGVSGSVRPQIEENHPVLHVSWNDAVAYCKWLSEKTGKHFRLPKEAEWEYAAAGIEKREYPWPKEKGEPNSKLLNYNGNVGQTTPVGSYPEGATPEGLYDMAGNVWEWTDSWYDSTCSNRVLRGGCWNSSAGNCRSALRNLNAPDYRSHGVGFRLVLAL